MSKHYVKGNYIQWGRQFEMKFDEFILEHGKISAQEKR